MKKIYKILPALLFSVFLGVGFLANIAKPNRAFSPRENRTLQMMPKISLESVFSGSFMQDYEKHVADQFIWRDAWVEIKAKTELALQKNDVKGVYIGEDGFIAERFQEPDRDRVASNAKRVEEFASILEIPVFFTVIPGAVEIWKERLPVHAQNADQKQIIELIASLAPSAVFVDSYGALYERKEESIYYKTDHHWTTLGAYYGYAAFASALEHELGNYPGSFMSKEGFYGTASSSCGLMPGLGDTVELAVPPSAFKEIIAYEGKEIKKIPAYDEAALEEKDKYTVFFGGNYPLMVVKSSTEGQKLLLIKDSYANAEIPFLTAIFGEIHVIDLRYYKDSISAYISENEIDIALISYHLPNFVTDTNLMFLTK